MDKVRIGVIGCGYISEKYIEHLTKLFRNTEVVAVSDLVESNARRRAEQFGISRVCKSNEELVGLPDVDLVVNLTTPEAHVAVTKLALEGGKHVYTEKPLALNFADGQALVELAAGKGLLVGSAPDTILGSGMQTARKLVDDGWIGKPIGAIMTHLRRGPESWHPDPDFLYKRGAGPIFDSGPYFILALAYLLGPAASAQCASKITFPERTITSQPRYGQKIQVEVPTYVSGTLTFRDGSIATLVLSDDVPGTRLQDPRQHNHAFELYGTEGTLSLPSPCYFDGQIYFRKLDMTDWIELPNLFGYSETIRGLGVAEMASALQHGRAPRLDASMALHALEMMCALEIASESGKACHIGSTFTRTSPMDLATTPGGVEAR
ncbi:MAG: Gfo/Idh/MocA family oxidoreductase [Candidatus Limnocylindrales bacterium]|jgi:predicted dehydrogenase